MAQALHGLACMTPSISATVAENSNSGKQVVDADGEATSSKRRQTTRSLRTLVVAKPVEWFLTSALMQA